MPSLIEDIEMTHPELEKAAEKHASLRHEKYLGSSLNGEWVHDYDTFLAGAHWQAERDREEIEKLRAEKEFWGNEFSAVIICKDEIERLKEHKRLLFEENSRLLTEKESGQWDKNEALLEENAKLRAENAKMRAVVTAARNEAHWHQASGVRGDRCGICIALIALTAIDGEMNEL